MIQFNYSPTTPTFKFSAKTSTIILPNSVKLMSTEEQGIVEEYCTLARDIYIRKVTDHTINCIGKKLCAIQVRNESLKEATSTLIDRYPDLPQVLQKIKDLAPPRKLKPKTSTYLDFIESTQENSI